MECRFYVLHGQTEEGEDTYNVLNDLPDTDNQAREALPDAPAFTCTAVSIDIDEDGFVTVTEAEVLWTQGGGEYYVDAATQTGMYDHD